MQQVSPMKHLVGWVGITDLRAVKGFHDHMDQVSELKLTNVGDFIVSYLEIAKLRPEPKNADFSSCFCYNASGPKNWTCFRIT